MVAAAGGTAADASRPAVGWSVAGRCIRPETSASGRARRAEHRARWVRRTERWPGWARRAGWVRRTDRRHRGAASSRPRSCRESSRPLTLPRGSRRCRLVVGRAGQGAARPGLGLALVTHQEPGRSGARAEDRTITPRDGSGSMLPERATDDTDQGWGEPTGGNDAWLLEQRPPHWD